MVKRTENRFYGPTSGQANNVINNLINNFKLYKINNNSLYHLQNIFKQI